MTSEVVVCTRNRLADVERLLGDLPGQTRKPRLVVVDSSDDSATREAVERFGASGVWSEVRYLHTEPGLTKQRMRGVAETGPDCEVVHFLDDDVLLDPRYFEVVESEFAEHAEVVGVGGLITDLPPHRPRFLNRVFLLDSARQGVVLASGANVKLYEARDRTRVDWLSGCCMSYRRSIFDRVAFDTSMVGYSLGEDVDFSYSARALGDLVVRPDARIQHLERGSADLDRSAFARQELVRRHRFVRKHASQGVNALAFWWSVGGDWLITFGKSLFFPNRQEWRDKLAGLAEGVREVRSRRGEADRT